MDPSPPPSWWHTMPGLLTALAGAITAIAGLIIALSQAGLLGSTPPPLRALERGRSLPCARDR